MEAAEKYCARESNQIEILRLLEGINLMIVVL